MRDGWQRGDRKGARGDGYRGTCRVDDRSKREANRWMVIKGRYRRTKVCEVDKVDFRIIYWLFLCLLLGGKKSVLTRTRTWDLLCVRQMWWPLHHEHLVPWAPKRVILCISNSICMESLFILLRFYTFIIFMDHICWYFLLFSFN